MATMTHHTKFAGELVPGDYARIARIMRDVVDVERVPGDDQVLVLARRGDGSVDTFALDIDRRVSTYIVEETNDER